MYRLFPILLAGLAFSHSGLSSPTSPKSILNPNHVINPADLVTTLYQSPANNTDWFENQVVLPNGHLLISSLFHGNVLTLDPYAQNPTPVIILHVDPEKSVLGLTALSDGLYAAIAGTQNGNAWEIISPALYVFTLDGHILEKILGPPTGSFLNGLATLPNKPYIALATDSIGGKVYRFNSKTKEYSVAVSNPALDPSPDLSVSLPLGANGIKIRDDYLYFTNSFQGIYARFKIDADGSKIGPVEILYKLRKPTGMGNFFDDLAFDSEGNAYIAHHYRGIYKITPKGETSVVPGTDEKDTKIRAPTAVGIAKDGRSIFVTTAATNFTGTFYAGGVFEVDLFGGKYGGERGRKWKGGY